MTNDGLDHGAHRHRPPLAPPDLQVKASLMEAEAEAVTVGNGNMGDGGSSGGGSGGDKDNCGGNRDGGGTENNLGLIWLMVGWENVTHI
jgi:hypothetical protein